MRIRRAVAVASAVSTTVVALTVVAPNASAQSDPKVIASGLDAPRHLTFSPDGTLYVVEAGRGGPRPGNCADHPLGNFCFGFTGAVTRVSETGADTRVLTGLPSIATEAEPLGPSDIQFTGNSKFVLSIGIGGSDTFREEFGDDGALLGTLVTGKLQKGGGITLLADVLANEAVANPEPEDIDSNPVGFVRQGDGYVLADAGGNAIVRVGHDGKITTMAVLPFDSAPLPFPPFIDIPTDPVPTSVVQGPDGAYYISQLTGFPFQPGDSDIWRLVPGGQPQIYASGLTNVTDLTFGPDGSLYAVEIASTGLLDPTATGSLLRINAGTSDHDTVLGGLVAPYGVAVRGDAAYVSTCAVCVGGGQVLKVGLD